MPSGIYDNAKRRKTSHPLKARVVCKKCCNIFLPDTSVQRGNRPCPHCGAMVDIRDRKGWFQEWSKKNPEKAEARKQAMILWNNKHDKERAKKNRSIMRKVIFNIVSDNNPVCENCGCDDPNLLEINHKNGGGTKEIRQKGRSFLQDIYSGRKTDDLNLLCKVCNALHYLELKNGKLPFKVTWIKNG